MKKMSTYTNASADGVPTGFAFGQVKNESSPGALDGTPVDASVFVDLAYALYAVLADQGVTPSGTTEDTASSHDFLDALYSLVAANTGGFLASNTTVNLDASMTAAEIQALIDAQPKNLNGLNLTFAFADGTYTLDSILTFKDFGNGTLSILGNTGEDENTLHTNQAVYLNFTGVTSGLRLTNNAQTYIHNLKIQITDTDTKACLYARFTTIRVQGCYFLNAGTTNSTIGVDANQVQTFVGYTYFSKMKYGVKQSIGCCSLTACDDTGTKPDYGVYANLGGVVGWTVSIPTGATADTLMANGGIVQYT